MSFLDAAIVILKEASRPMTACELADVALARGLVTTSGKTPDATLAAQLYLRVKQEPNGSLRRVAVAGPRRAQRGSVGWVWRQKI